MTDEIIVCRAGYCNDDDEDPKCCAVCDTRKKCDDPCNHAEEGICNHQVFTTSHSYHSQHPALAKEVNRTAGTVCSNCGDPVSEDDMYHNEDSSILCESCYDELYTECHRCGSSGLKENMREVDGEYYCQSCYDDHFIGCELCGGTISVDDSFNMKKDDGNEITVCEGCFDDRSRKCDGCEEYWDRGDIRETEEGNGYCPDCFPNHTGDCSQCGETHDNIELETIGEEMYCKDCAEEHRANHPTEETEEPSS